MARRETTIHFTTLEIFVQKIKKVAADHEMKLTEVDKDTANRRLENAYDEIEGALMSRSLTVVQISTWARGEEYQLDIAMYFYCKDSGWGGRLEEETDWTTVFDRRKELVKIPIVSNDGVLLSKNAGAVARGMDLEKINENLGISYS